MRKGFSLIELLVIIAVLPIIMLVINGLFASMFSDVPKSWNTIQNNTTLLNMLEQMQHDIDTAKDLPQSIDEYTSGDELLIIEQADGIIHYQRKDNYIYRYKFKNGGQIPEQTRYWLVPKTIITWQIRRESGKGYAVEVRHNAEYMMQGHLIKKMENSHLFYCGILE